MPEYFGGAEFVNQTVMHPLALFLLIIFGIAIIVLPRRYAVLPMVLAACFISPAQRLSISSLDFDITRILVLFGMIRILFKGEYKNFQFSKLDLVLICWGMSSVLFNFLGRLTLDALINRLGFFYDVIGMYFIFRCLIKTWTDIDSILVGFVVISVPVLVAFILESRTGRNVFSIFGGVPEITVVRDGRLRCQGAFAHPIIAGCFWTSMIPLYAAKWFNGKTLDHLISISGVFIAVCIAFLCASSTPIMSIMAATFGGIMFYFRSQLKIIRWAIVTGLIALNFIMEGPVWSLIAKLSPMGSSASWHRYNLINQAFVHIREWWFAGTASTAHWGWGLQDVTCQYVMEGVTGGLATVVLFLAFLFYLFKNVGYLIRIYKNNRILLIYSWALGVVIFIHAVNFIGLTYFGQMPMIWYLHAAMVSSMAVACSQKRIKAIKNYIKRDIHIRAV